MNKFDMGCGQNFLSSPRNSGFVCMEVAESELPLLELNSFFPRMISLPLILGIYINLSYFTLRVPFSRIIRVVPGNQKERTAGSYI